MASQEDPEDPWSFLTFDKLLVKPPISTNSVTQFYPSMIRSDAEATRITVHPRFPQLVQRFLQHKLSRGSNIEKALYQTMTWQQLVSRLIEKRPLVFMSGSDHTVLRDGTMPLQEMTNEWDRNGTAQESKNRYIKLEDYLSYDEIMLGSLIGVSGPSYFINDGNRYNSGKPAAAEGPIERRGVIIGLVGARFEREARMDSIFCLGGNNKNGMGEELREAFAEFFGAPGCPDKKSFNMAWYKARIGITADILLLEANSRAAEAGKKAHVYVVGLGLGVWEHSSDQAAYYIDAFATAIARHELPNIGTIEFAWINVPKSTPAKVTEAAAEKGIKVIFSRRNPAEKLESGELLVLSYAWDGNAFPGNEYWQGSLCGSGDPAAACMSTIGELHNPLANPYTSRVQVVGT